MKSLFLRIFLWFWLAMVAVVGVAVLTSPYWTRVRPAVARWEQRTFVRLVQEATAATALVNEKGLGSLPRRRRNREDRLLVQVVNASGEISGGRPLPAVVAEVAARSVASGELELERIGPHFVLARPLILDDGRAMTLVVADRVGRRGFGPPELGPETGVLEAPLLLPRLLGVILVVGVLSYWLSHHLTAPLRTLGEAVRGLDGGDLEARAGAEVADRRDEIGALARDFNRMADRLVGSIESQRRLLRDVSHELRSPLARLKVAIELARRCTADTDHEPLDRIDRESDRMEDLVGHLLTLARLEQGGDLGPAESVDLVALAETVAADATFELEDGAVTVLSEGESPHTVLGDTSLLRSAMDNVVRNALRHGGGTVEVLVTRPSPDLCRVHIKDRGPGVPDEYLEGIFDPFHRVADDRDPTTGGTGLGLAISRRAVVLHGGTIYARNLPEGGLEVVMVLPVVTSI